MLFATFYIRNLYKLIQQNARIMKFDIEIKQTKFNTVSEVPCVVFVIRHIKVCAVKKSIFFHCDLLISSWEKTYRVTETKQQYCNIV